MSLTPTLSFARPARRTFMKARDRIVECVVQLGKALSRENYCAALSSGAACQYPVKVTICILTFRLS